MKLSPTDLVLAILCPPIAVLGSGCFSLLIAIALTACGWIPGVIWALFVLNRGDYRDGQTRRSLPLKGKKRLLDVLEIPEEQIESMSEKEAYAHLAEEFRWVFQATYFIALTMFAFLFGLEWALFDAIIPQLASFHFWIGLVGVVLVSKMLLIDNFGVAFVGRGITGLRMSILLTVLWAALIAAFVPQFIVDVFDYFVLNLFGVEYVPSRWS